MDASSIFECATGRDYTSRAVERQSNPALEKSGFFEKSNAVWFKNFFRRVHWRMGDEEYVVGTILPLAKNNVP
jgi:hypothetical protein